MCDFYTELDLAIQDLMRTKTEFDIIDVLNTARAVSPGKNIPWIDKVNGSLKFETLTYFESGKMPGWIADLKVVDQAQHAGARKTAWVFKKVTAHKSPAMKNWVKVGG